ncbi:unnamed protein product [Orchesella dallaii]|uniref:Uncharacterized protein n=1 Tax=Orchesella dallaii TaxID=48710 RepID=A0ABP1RY86_9HEXA
MQWSSVVPNEYAIGRRQDVFLSENYFRIKSELGFKIAVVCAFLDVILSITFIAIILSLSPVLLSPPPPRLIMLTESEPSQSPSFNYTNLNETNPPILIPPISNVSEAPMERTFYCEKIGRQVVLADFLAQLIYTGGGISVVFGALTKRVTLCYIHFPCSLLAIIFGVGIRIVEVIYCKWFLMRWLGFVLQFVWYSLGDVVAKSLTVYLEEKEHQMERTPQGKLIVPIT